MSKIIAFEFEFTPNGRPKLFATAHLRHEGSAMDACQWSVERIDAKERLTAVDRSEMEVYLREWKADAIARKFKARLAWAA